MPRRPSLLIVLASLLVSLAAATRQHARHHHLHHHRGALSAFLAGTGIMQRPPTPARSLGICHTFAGLALDRSRVVELKDAQAFQDALQRPDSAFVLFHGTSALVKYPSSAAGGAAAPAPVIAYQTREELAGRLAISVEDLVPRPPPPAGQKQEGAGGGLTCVALGAGADPQWVFALDVSARPKEEVEAQAAAGDGAARVVFEPVRGLMATMVQAEIAVCGQGGALLAWHRLNHYCGVCGSPMLAVEAGGRRACTSCRNRAYPRIDPVVISLVYHPPSDRILLGRQKVYRAGMYSCLAGYAEQCESLEEAIRREVKEESGIDVGKVEFHSSQPWPIGRGASCQLMVGFVCEATSTDIKMDGEELEDARWFSREEVAAAKELVVTPLQHGGGAGSGSEDAGGPPPLSIPGPYAIAHHLIRHWLETPPRHRL